MISNLPNLNSELFVQPAAGLPQSAAPTNPPPHSPRILLLYGSVRERSYSRLATEEAERLLQAMDCETKTFNPSGLPLPDDAADSHPKVQELDRKSVV